MFLSTIFFNVTIFSVSHKAELLKENIMLLLLLLIIQLKLIILKEEWDKKVCPSIKEKHFNFFKHADSHVMFYIKKMILKGRIGWNCNLRVWQALQGKTSCVSLVSWACLCTYTSLHMFVVMHTLQHWHDWFVQLIPFLLKLFMLVKGWHKL